MNTTKPLFEVGEVVIRQAPHGSYPQHNGEYVVLDIIPKEFIHALYPNIRILSDWYYELDGLEIQLTRASTGEQTGTLAKHCGEKFLRKKHQPGEFDFVSLMAHLKTPVFEPGALRV